jgi:transcriptional regulator with XRE-family HTH domain
MQARASRFAYTWPMPRGPKANKPAPQFGKRMAAFRIARGLSQAGLGEALGLSRDMVAYYERTSPNPSLEFVKQVADFFSVTVGELLNDTAKARKPGPPSKLEELTARLARLPANEQKVVIKMLEGALPKAS